MIGILSMQHVVNYGSFLQAYGLKKTVENMGYDVSFIQIKIEQVSINKERESNKITVSFLIKRIDKYILKRLQHYSFIKKRERLFKNDLFEKSGINSPVEEAECDAIIIGSDEVFNCGQTSMWGHSLQLFGDVNCNHVFSYAGSFGNTTISYLKDNNINSKISAAMNRMDGISVRDNNSKEIVYELLGKTPYIHLDPVFIYDFTKERKNAVKLSNYILIYAYDNRINDKNEIKRIKEFAKAKNKRLISVGTFQNWCDRNILCDPFELINYFEMADYVITDTFHGTVFSIKTNRQFVTIIRDSNCVKLSDLLHRFDLDNRIVKDTALISGVIDEVIDYKRVNEFIASEKSRSIEYLEKCIGRVYENETE